MNRIRLLRHEKGISMKKLGLSLGVSESTISMYETGKRQPDNDMLVKIANYFNVSTDYLLCNDIKKEPVTDTDDGIKSYIEQIKSMSGEDLALLNAVLNYVRSKREK